MFQETQQKHLLPCSVQTMRCWLRARHSSSSSNTHECAVDGADGEQEERSMKNGWIQVSSPPRFMSRALQAVQETCYAEAQSQGWNTALFIEDSTLQKRDSEDAEVKGWVRIVPGRCAECRRPVRAGGEVPLVVLSVGGRHVSLGERSRLKEARRVFPAAHGHVFLDAPGTADGSLCKGQPSSVAPCSFSAKHRHYVPTKHSGPVGAGCAAAAEAAMAVADVASHPGMVVASLSSEVQYCYQLRSRVLPPPNALMPFAQEKRLSVAAVNANENNRRDRSRLAKLCRPLRAADKEPFQRKVVEAAAVPRRKYPDYAHNPHEARRRKEQERSAKQVTSKLVQAGTSWDNDQQLRTSTVAAQGRGSPKLQQQLHPTSFEREFWMEGGSILHGDAAWRGRL
ncbi:hypothetical protein HPB49_012948 [Dermacentor silvarum]|uniref:Uncharacterized protein n=1 Tax=Dermacentor silvarum TaxID=543639 RepID=A0ACB8E0E0_DERSI|nr:hypothetical protein HPB49_012948 [Dermacentor silvarum]